MTEIADEVVAILEQLELDDVTVAHPDSGADLEFRFDGRALRLELKYRSLIDAPFAERIGATSDGDRMLLIVGDRIVGPARKILGARGLSWVDLRGHVRLRAPGLVIDSQIAPYRRAHRSPGRASSSVGTLVAVDLLLHPERRPTVRSLAERVGAAPSSVSTTLRTLGAAGLLQPDGRAAPQALFSWLADEWRPEWIWCEREPEPDPEMRNPALQLGLHDDPEAPGWSLTGDHAAFSLGARFAANTRTPLSFYLPTPRSLRLARTALRESPRASAKTRLALAPVDAACTNRIDVAATTDQHWRLAQPLFIALELAQDPGRGSEILQSFEPVYGPRVW